LVKEGRQAAREFGRKDPTRIQIRARGGTLDKLGDTKLGEKVPGLKREFDPDFIADELPGPPPGEIIPGEHVPDLALFDEAPLPRTKDYKFVTTRVQTTAGAKTLRIPQSYEADQIKMYLEKGKRLVRGEVGEEKGKYPDFDDPRVRAAAIKKGRLPGAAEQDIYTAELAEEMEIFLRGQQSTILGPIREGKLPKSFDHLTDETIEWLRERMHGDPNSPTTRHAAKYMSYLNMEETMRKAASSETAQKLGLAADDPRARFDEEYFKKLPKNLKDAPADDVLKLKEKAQQVLDRSRNPKTIEKWQKRINELDKLYNEKRTAAADVKKTPPPDDEGGPPSIPPPPTAPETPPAPPKAGPPAGRAEQRGTPRPEPKGPGAKSIEEGNALLGVDRRG
jgi:hypothetical protein